MSAPLHDGQNPPGRVRAGKSDRPPGTGAPRQDWSGSDVVWSITSLLVAGPAVWGGIGYGADRLLGTFAFLPVGLVVGFATAFYIIWVRYIRETDGVGLGRGPEQEDRR